MRTRSPLLAATLAVYGGLAAQAQTPTITAVVSNATLNAGPSPIAPGENIHINGSSLGDPNQQNCRNANGSLPATCNGVSVTIGGKAAPLFSESAAVLSAQVPVDVALGSAQVVVSRVTGPGQNATSLPFNVTLNATAPQLYSSVNNNIAFAQCFDGSGNPIGAANPATPGEVVSCQGTGFGVTNPVVPSGAVTPATPPAIAAPVTVSVGSQGATVKSATLVANTPGGAAQVTFQIPSNAAPGPIPIALSVGGVNAQTVDIFVQLNGPTVNLVVNSASNAVPGLPNAGVAPGSIVVVYGKQLGPDKLVTAPGYPWPATLSGTSAQVTVAGKTVDLLLYYTSATQIAGLLPSSTPPGNGTLAVTYNGQAGNPGPIQVVANNFGVYTVSQNGQGPGIVTFADYSLVSQTRAANPGETLIVWGTGLGAVAGDEASGPLPGDMPNLPVQVFVGGVPASVVYRGRSGCCVGEDQIAFVVPANLAGCLVPVWVKINNQVSNFSTIGVAPAGRTCVPSISQIPPAFTSVAQPRIVLLQLKRTVNPPPQSPNDSPSSDDATVSPFKLGVSGADLNAALDGPPLGSCYVVANYNGNNYTPPVLGLLDAGTSLILQGPNGTSRTIARSGQGYAAHLGDTTAGNFLDPGAYTFSGPGGADVGSFQAQFNIPPFTWTNKPANNGLVQVNRNNPLTINWTGGDPNGYVQIQGFSGSSTVNATFACNAATSAGSITIPPNVLLAMPGASGGSINVIAKSAIAGFTATGLDFGGVMFEVNIGGPAQFQ